MKITAKIKLGAHASKIESFGNNRYLVYLISELGDSEAMSEFLALMSRHLGVAEKKIIYIGKDVHGDKMFEIN